MESWEWLRKASLYLKENNPSLSVDEHYLEAKFLFDSFAEKNRVIFRSGDDNENWEKFRTLLDRRLQGEPLQYIIGEWDFYDITLKVGEGVLIPRPETEHLAQEALKLINGRTDLNIIDLCSGTGCVPIVISEHTDGCTVWAVEKYDEAYKFLEENNRRYGSKVKLIKDDIYNADNFGGTYDLITCNPPYITAEAMKELDESVKREPFSALFGGEDGLDFYRLLRDKWLDKLNPCGALITEIGYDQGECVKNLFINEGYAVNVVKDYAGHDRVVIVIKES